MGSTDQSPDRLEAFGTGVIGFYIFFVMLNKKVFGYFEGNDEVPSHDPGLNTYCLFCTKPLSKPIKTISLLGNNDNISYFYRCHKECYENKSEEEIMQYESSIIDKTFNS